MVEKHTGKNEMYEVFNGLRFTKRNSLRSLKSARAKGRFYAEQGYLYRIEREKLGVYHVYTRRQ